MTDKIDDIKAKIASYKRWFHSIEVAPGVVTPGKTKSELVTMQQMTKMGLPKDCSGLRVLDIGANDGYYTFEIEKRGGSVMSLDRRTEGQTGYEILHEYFNSKAERVIDNVYNLVPEKYGTFDIIVFLNVLYHLRNPMLALDRIRTLCKPTTKVFIKTIVIDTRFVLQNGEEVNLEKVAPELVDIPIAQFYNKQNIYNDHSVRWVTNIAGIEEMLSACCFTVNDKYLMGKNRYLCACSPNNDVTEEYSAQLDYAESNTHITVPRRQKV